jgi:predicted RND superfamily exporter protein
MFLGGIGRLLSLAVRGAPHWFQIPLTVIELVVPPLIVALTVDFRKGRR